MKKQSARKTPKEVVVEKSTSDIFPIGKYKGQPVSRVLQDGQYCLWFVKQQWFEEKYPEFYKLLLPAAEEAQEVIREYRKMNKIKEEKERDLSITAQQVLEKPTPAYLEKYLEWLENEKKIPVTRFSVDGNKFFATYRVFLKSNPKMNCWN